VPGAGHEAVDDAAFADRPVLMGAKIGERADRIAVAKDGALLVSEDANGTIWRISRAKNAQN